MCCCWTLWECGEVVISPLLLVVVLKWVTSPYKERQIQVLFCWKLLVFRMGRTILKRTATKTYMYQTNHCQNCWYFVTEGISTTNEEQSLCQHMLIDVNNYMESCKTTNLSIYSSEIQNKLVKNNSSFQSLQFDWQLPNEIYTVRRIKHW